MNRNVICFWFNTGWWDYFYFFAPATGVSSSVPEVSSWHPPIMM